MAIARGEYTVSTLKDSTKKVYFAYADSPDGLTNFSLSPGTRTYLGTFVDEDRDVLQAAVDAPVVAGNGRNLISNRPDAWESGWLITTSGAEMVAGARIRTRDYIPVTPLEPYVFTSTHNATVGVYGVAQFYDVDNAWISAWYLGTASGKPVGVTFILSGIAPANASKMRFALMSQQSVVSMNELNDSLFVKLEKGTTASPWTPAPEDVLAELDAKIADPASYTWVLIKGAKGDTGDQGPKGDTGNTGATGRGVMSVAKQFYLSTSKTTQTGGTWSTSMPTWEFGKYLWTRDLITYTTGTPATTTTTPQVSSEWEAVVSHDADLTAHGIKFTEISQTVNGLGEVVGTHTTNISELTAASLEISQTLGKGGENLLPNPTFGTKNMADKGGWSTGYLVQLLAARFAGKTMAEMQVTLQGKTTQDLINYNY